MKQNQNNRAQEARLQSGCQGSREEALPLHLYITKVEMGGADADETWWTEELPKSARLLHLPWLSIVYFPSVLTQVGTTRGMGQVSLGHRALGGCMFFVEGGHQNGNPFAKQEHAALFDIFNILTLHMEYPLGTASSP
eukprot:944030-Amphidinium_carterae.2